MINHTLSAIHMTLEEPYRSLGFSLPRLFLIIALPMMIFFALFVPPFQVPDELPHLFRADQLSYGDIVGTRLDDTQSGGSIDKSYRLLFQVFEKEGRVSKEMFTEADQIPLTGEREFSSFAYTVLYGPFMYIPQALTLFMARKIEANALPAFYCARLFNGLIALLVGFMALRIAKQGRFLIFSVLTMPMTLSLTGSISQDALLLSGSALFLAIVSNVLSLGRTPTLKINITLIFLLIALALGRLPYLLLGVIFLLKPFSSLQLGNSVLKRWPGFAALLSVFILVAAWGKIIGTLEVTHVPLASSSAQITFLLSHPWLLPVIAFDTLKSYGLTYSAGFFGILGLYNVSLPFFFYLIAFLGLCGAFLLEMTCEPRTLKIRDRWLIAIALMIGIGAVFLALYLTYTPVGQLKIQGVQGRYFIPFLLPLAFIVPSISIKKERLKKPLLILLPMVSIIGALTSIERIIVFYY